MSKAETSVNLVDFMRAKRREVCPVCKLPVEVRAQIASASDKGIKRKMVLEWLRESYGIAITEDQMSSHRNGRHDE